MISSVCFLAVIAWRLGVEALGQQNCAAFPLHRALRFQKGVLRWEGLVGLGWASRRGYLQEQ